MPRSSRLFACALLLILPGVASAQSSDLTGRITDSSGAALTLVSPTTGAARATATNPSGLYVFPAVSPGRYRLTIGHPGFRTVARDGVVVNVGTTTTENARPEPGDVKEVITVEGQVPKRNSRSLPGPASAPGTVTVTKKSTA